MIIVVPVTLQPLWYSVALAVSLECVQVLFPLGGMDEGHRIE